LSGKPNIILVTTDQQRFDTTGPRAPSFMRTPHMDLLAREGVRFVNAYADCPICVPSRVSIMTGKDVTTHGVTQNFETRDYIDRESSLPGRLRKAGYQSAAIGKMHFGPQRVRHGFDEMILPDDYYREMKSVSGVGQPMRHGLGQNELYPGMATVPESYTLTSWITDQCLEYIKHRRDPSVPYFLWCSFSKPHPPLDPPEPYYSMYRDAEIPEPWIGNWCDSEDCPEAFNDLRHSWSLDLIAPEVILAARAAYYGLITQIDYNMGRVFAALQDDNAFADTMIIFTSDHGEFIGDHHSGCKVFPHEGSAHIPMILRLPQSWANRPNNVQADTPVNCADVFTTILSAADGDTSGVDGRDMTALARGNTENGRSWIVSCAGASLEKAEYYGLTDGKWKYIWYPDGASEQLFHLTADPHELDDISGDKKHESQKSELHKTLIAQLALRCPQVLENEDLPKRPLKKRTENDLRNSAWPGFHSEDYEVDVRH